MTEVPHRSCTLRPSSSVCKTNWPRKVVYGLKRSESKLNSGYFISLVQKVNNANILGCSFSYVFKQNIIGTRFYHASCISKTQHRQQQPEEERKYNLRRRVKNLKLHTSSKLNKSATNGRVCTIFDKINTKLMHSHFYRIIVWTLRDEATHPKNQREWWLLLALSNTD